MRKKPEKANGLWVELLHKVTWITFQSKRKIKLLLVMPCLFDKKIVEDILSISGVVVISHNVVFVDQIYPLQNCIWFKCDTLCWNQHVNMAIRALWRWRQPQQLRIFVDLVEEVKEMDQIKDFATKHIAKRRYTSKLKPRTIDGVTLYWSRWWNQPEREICSQIGKGLSEYDKIYPGEHIN